MAIEEVLWMPGEWHVGEVVQIDRNGKVVVRGRVKEVIGSPNEHLLRGPTRLSRTP